MHRRTARGNRLGLALTGLLLLLAGAALLLTSRGVFGKDVSHTPTYTAAISKFIHSNTGWLWPVAAAVAVIVGLVFLRWLLVQLRVDRIRRVTLDSEEPNAGDSGRSTMPAGALTDAVADDVESYRGVRRADVALTGPSDSPSLWIDLRTDADADLGRIRQRVSAEAIPAARASLEQPELPSYVHLRVTRRTGGRTVA